MRPLGILLAANRPVLIPGGIARADSYACPAIFETIAEGWVDRILAGDPALEPAMVDAARRLVARGAQAVISNCGFSIHYQAAVAAAVPVPVGLSGLLAPGALGAPSGLPGILSYDSRLLSAAHLALAGLPPEAAVAGFQSTATARRLLAKEPDVSAETMRREVVDLARALVAARPEIALLIVECGGFTPFAEEIHTATGRPVQDVIALGHHLMGAADPRALGA